MKSITCCTLYGDVQWRPTEAPVDSGILRFNDNARSSGSCNTLLQNLLTGGQGPHTHSSYLTLSSLLRAKGQPGGILFGTTRIISWSSRYQATTPKPQQGHIHMGQQLLLLRDTRLGYYIHPTLRANALGSSSHMQTLRTNPWYMAMPTRTCACAAKVYALNTICNTLLQNLLTAQLHTWNGTTYTQHLFHTFVLASCKGQPGGAMFRTTRIISQLSTPPKLPSH